MNRFTYNETDNYFTVEFGDKKILIDPSKLENLFFDDRARTNTIKWKEEIGGDLYFLDTNQKKINMLEKIYNIPYENYTWEFKNGNNLDLRKCNMDIKPLINIKLPKNLIIIQEFMGHLSLLGKSAGKNKNPYWLVKDETIQTDPFYVMFCEKESFCYFSQESLKDIVNDNNYTWYLMQNGYIGAHINNTIIYMHQIIMNYYAHGNKTENIDHINRKKLDNRTVNLRITTQSVQNSNRDKSARKCNAKPLPEDMKQSDLPKYVVYYKEKTGNGFREFFKIEKHASLEKPWATTKAKDVSIQDKLKQVKDKLSELNELNEIK